MFQGSGRSAACQTRTIGAGVHPEQRSKRATDQGTKEAFLLPNLKVLQEKAQPYPCGVFDDPRNPRERERGGERMAKTRWPPSLMSRSLIAAGGHWPPDGKYRGFEWELGRGPPPSFSWGVERSKKPWSGAKRREGFTSVWREETTRLGEWRLMVRIISSASRLLT